MNPLSARPRIERTRNKHSRAVLRKNRIVIRLARNLSTAQEREHIDSLLRRMRVLAKEEMRKKTLSPFAHLLNGGQSLTVTLARDKKYVFRMTPGQRTRARRSSEGWDVTVGPNIRRKGLERFLWKLLSLSERAWMERMVGEINAECMGVRIRGVRLAFATSQWGSCSPDGIIMINTALLFVPFAVLRYVIVHELAHRRKTDHSPAFWAEVERGMPRYKAAREALLHYRLPEL